MFFLGVLGWPPMALQDAGVDDLSDAFEGFARHGGFYRERISVPSDQFFAEMTNRFPDRKEG